MQEPEDRGGRLGVSLGILTTIAMAGATFGGPALGIVASYVIVDVGVSHTAVGWAISSIVGTALVLSLKAGELTDSLGGKLALVLVLAASAAGFVVMGSGRSFGWVLAGAAVSGVSLSFANPATNRLIAEHAAEGHRALVTGLKQSGAQGAVVVGGLVLPLLADAYGWRAALSSVAVVPVAAAAVAARVVPGDRKPIAAVHAVTEAVAQIVRHIALLGVALGFASASALFVPLFAVETLGLSLPKAGIAVSLIGVAGIVGRLGWAEITERLASPFAPIVVLASLSAVGGLGLIGASRYTLLLWPAAVVVGLGSRSWTAVAAILVMRSGEIDTAGRSSGIVSAGYFLGMGLAPPIYGMVIDSQSEYSTVWLLAIVSSLIAVAVAIKGHSSSRRQSP